MARLEHTLTITANGTVDANGDPARISEVGQHRIIASGDFGGGTLSAFEYSTTTGATTTNVTGFPLTATGAVTTNSPFYQLSLAGATAPNITIVVTPIISLERSA